MYGVQRSWRGWNFMLHGSAFAQFIYEPGDIHRTGGFATQQLSSVNWGMVMARRPVGDGRIGFRLMSSLEPWTVTDCGFLNLLANGEVCEGDTIHDRQHPHDLFMELAADYDRPLRGSLRWQIYAGLSGEPALGPAAFRIASQRWPIPSRRSPITGSTPRTSPSASSPPRIYDERWKTEMSLFNGREPDDDRANLDLAPLDSISGRFSSSAHASPGGSGVSRAPQRGGSGVCPAAAHRPESLHRFRHLPSDVWRERLGHDAGVRCELGTRNHSRRRDRSRHARTHAGKQPDVSRTTDVVRQGRTGRKTSARSARARISRRVYSPLASWRPATSATSRPGTASSRNRWRLLAEHRAVRTRTPLHQPGQARIRRVRHHTPGPPRDVSGFRLSRKISSA